MTRRRSPPMQAAPSHLDLMEDLFYAAEPPVRLRPEERDALAKRTPEDARALARQLIKGPNFK